MTPPAIASMGHARWQVEPWGGTGTVLRIQFAGSSRPRVIDYLKFVQGSWRTVDHDEQYLIKQGAYL